MKQGKEISFTSSGSGAADFNYSIKGKVISITDLKLGTQSFTQEIEKGSVNKSASSLFQVGNLRSGVPPE